MKLKLKTMTEYPHRLEEFGYFNNILDSANEPIFVYDDGSFEAIKTVDSEKVAISINRYIDYEDITHDEMCLYRYHGEEHHHVEVCSIEGIEAIPFIQDLIDAKLVEVIFE